jgi:FdhD protein
VWTSQRFDRDTTRGNLDVDGKTSGNVTYLRYAGGESKPMERPVVREAPWTIHVNDQELATLYCTPDKLNFLVLGFLASEGIIESLDDVLLLQVCEDEEGVIDVKVDGQNVTLPGRPILLSGCGRGVTFEDLSATYPKMSSPVQVPASQISRLMQELRRQAEVHQAAGGTHASALSDGNQLLVVSEDVGRHNTLDKIRGECLFHGISTKERLLLTTGRISSEMVTKAVKMEVPIVASRSTPTDLAVKLARDWEMTIVGYVRGGKMNVYSRPDRITTT